MGFRQSAWLPAYPNSKSASREKIVDSNDDDSLPGTVPRGTKEYPATHNGRRPRRENTLHPERFPISTNTENQIMFLIEPV